MGEREKAGWTKPELIVLTRGRPEEAILTACKGDGNFGPVSIDGRCLQANCETNCDVLAPS